jgi:hypothetical protein
MLVGSALVVGQGASATAARPPAEEPPLPGVQFELAGRYDTGGGEATAEIAAFDDGHLYVTNGSAIDIVDIADPSAPQKVSSLTVGGVGLGEPTSVAVHRGLVAVALPADPKTDPGVVQFFREERKVGEVEVGALPDMVTFTPDGRHLLVANEGEPNSYGQPDSVDPAGSVSVIPTVPYWFDGFLQRMLGRLQPPRTAGFEAFDEGGTRHDELPDDVRIFGPGASVSQDLEPEYITADNRTAWVTLQENNAVATVDLRTAHVEEIAALGTKDHSVPGSGLDPSDRDGGIAVDTWPVQGMYQPDAVAHYRSGGDTYLVTANEGDAREYDGFEEEDRAGDVADLDLLPAAGDDAQLGRLTVTTAAPTPADGSDLYAFGGRSFSIWGPDGELVFDSGDDFERITAATNPEFFNSNNDENTFDDRSDNKGPEPEGVAVGRIGRKTYAFVALERVGGTMVYDVTDPEAPVFQHYLTSRDYAGEDVGPDSGPEGVVFIPADESPTGRALVAVSHEITGTVALWETVPAAGGGT